MSFIFAIRVKGNAQFGVLMNSELVMPVTTQVAVLSVKGRACFLSSTVQYLMRSLLLFVSYCGFRFTTAYS